VLIEEKMKIRETGLLNFTKNSFFEAYKQVLNFANGPANNKS
jgi:hypothetical protein